MPTLADRAFNYGDGVFTTMYVENGIIEHERLHMARLVSDASRIGLQLAERELLEESRNQARELGYGVLKCLVSGGEGGRGYQRPEAVTPGIFFTTHSIPPHYAGWRLKGIDVAVSQVTLARQPLLAGIKHVNRLEQVLVKSELARMPVDDLIVTDTKGNVVEASAANIFWQYQGQWFTPELTSAGVAGVMREAVMSQLAAMGTPVKLCEVGIDELNSAESLILCNALMGVVPVRTLYVQNEARHFSITAHQPIIPQLTANRMN